MLYGGPTHLKVIAEREMETKANVFGVVPDIISDPHESVMELRHMCQQPLQCSLSDCLHIYTKEETVSVKNSRVELLCIYMRSLPHSLGRFEYTVSHTSRSALAYNMLHTCASVNHTMIDMKEPFSAILLLYLASEYL